MRRLVVLLAVMAGTIFTIGVAAPAASAGNCSFINNGATYYSAPYLWFNAQVGVCSGVNRIQWGNKENISQPDATGYWFSGTENLVRQSCCWAGTGLIQWSPGSGQHWVAYAINPWCGGANEWVSTTFTYRIESIDIHGVTSWGPWHRTSSGGYVIQC